MTKLRVYMMHIDPNVYYYIPKIFNTLRDVYRIEFIRSRKQLTWTQYIASLDMGIEMGIEHDGRSYHPQNAMFDKDSLISDYYRIVCPKKFMMHAIRPGITITSTTPTRVTLSKETAYK